MEGIHHDGAFSMREYDGAYNCHTIYMGGSQVLGIQCQGCAHRGIMYDPALFHRGNMKRLMDLRLKCTKCGGTAVRYFTANTVAECEDWRDGKIV